MTGPSTELKRRNPPKKPKMGRPRLEFDLDEVEKLGALHITHEEIAAYFDCSQDTMRDRFHNDAEFREAFQRGQAKSKVNLRRRQIEVAQHENVAMLIWLGKQLLGQQEAPLVNVSATATAGNVIVRDPEQVKAHLVDLQKAVLAEARRLNLDTSNGSG